MEDPEGFEPVKGRNESMSLAGNKGSIQRQVEPVRGPENLREQQHGAPVSHLEQVVPLTLLPADWERSK